MGDDARPESSGEDTACAWCGRELPPEERERRVCQRCLRKLLDAGLSDEEIFGGPAGE